MRTLLKSAFLCAVIVTSATGLLAADESPQLEFTRLDLTDGRTLKDVVIKSYDAKTDRLLILTGKKAMTLPLSLVPAAVRARFRTDAPASGSTTNVMHEEPKRTPPAPAPVPPPVVTVIQQPTQPAVDPAQQLEALKAAHRAVALQRAEKFYRYEFPMGSSYVRVTAQDFEATVPREVPGWSGRFETTGKVFLEYFDSVGRSFKRTTSTFTVLTETKPDQGIVVVGFDTKT